MKNLALIAMSINTVTTCAEQLRHLLDERVNIKHYAVRTGGLPAHIQADLIVFLSEEACEQAVEHCTGSPVLIARRSINYHEVNKLLEIPAGTDVLLVNDLINSANTTIALLQTLGIDHINYYPCCPQLHNYPPLKIAVTPGESQLVPKCVETIIDIHTRLIDITTIVEILIRLDLLSFYADFLSANYVQDIIRLNKISHKDLTEIQRLEELVQQKQLKEQNIAPATLEKTIGRSPAILQTIKMAHNMALSDSTILIQGESGTGKELIAQGIHNASARHSGPFVAVNFAALSENLLESELFGYVPGAFTGASRHGSAGLFEEAHHGTLFLDEIGDAPLPFQVRLLRVLQEKQIRRVGSTKIIPIDVRIIVATNRNLQLLIAQNKFRRDLYYRLNVLPIHLPPLRERGDDILLLAKAFYKRHIAARNIQPLPAAEYFQHITDALLCYRWPGNIRELQNIVEYLTALSPAEAPSLALLPEEFHTPGAMALTVPAETDLREIVYETIQEANRTHKALGRRSLAKKLHQPENRIRQVLEELAQSKKIILRKGRSGLLAIGS